MEYRLVSALTADEGWLERLRRDVYQELFQATWGGWDEARHARHFAECLQGGNISVIEVNGTRVGMIQLFDQPDTVEVGEIQVQPGYQNRGIGTYVLRDTIDKAHRQRKKVFLAVGLKNDKALRLYQRLGFRQVARTDTHNHLVCEPVG
jgi:ribosomal protein S18 acetylase RimI-like enzyme